MYLRLLFIPRISRPWTIDGVGVELHGSCVEGPWFESRFCVAVS